MADDNNLIPISDEQAKLGQEALKALRGLGSFMEKALGSVPEDLVGYLGGDWLRLRRVENIAKLLSSTKERLEERGIKDTKPASLTLALPILRGAADESREELRDLWARLLAAAMDPSKEKCIRLGFADAIRKMDPLDALVLERIRCMNKVFDSIEKATLAREHKVSTNELVVSLSNLSKIGLTYERQQETGDLAPAGETQLEFYDTLPTPFGREFLRIVMD